jgi:hypothetical protein
VHKPLFGHFFTVVGELECGKAALFVSESKLRDWDGPESSLWHSMEHLFVSQPMPHADLYPGNRNTPQLYQIISFTRNPQFHSGRQTQFRRRFKFTRGTLSSTAHSQPEYQRQRSPDPHHPSNHTAHHPLTPLPQHLYPPNQSFPQISRVEKPVCLIRPDNETPANLRAREPTQRLLR